MAVEDTARSSPFAITDRFPALLAVTTLGVYLLVVVGATTNLADGAAACSTWPTCDGRLLALDGGAATVASAHRLVAFVVGLLLLASAAVSLRDDVERRTVGVLVGATLLYGVQVGIGAWTALWGARPWLSALHLLVGMAIFAALVVTLTWTLDARYGHRPFHHEGSEDPAPSAGREQLPADGAGDDTDRRPAGPVPTDLRTRLVAYVRLTKPRLMWLLCLVAVAAMALAAGPSLTPGPVLATVVAGMLAIGASGTFNHVLERDVDRHMRRTADRPVATHEVPAANAIAFGVVLAIASLAVFYRYVDPLAAVLGAIAIVFYSVVYTLLLKPNTVQNTVIGGIAGALPALIGWAAVTGRLGLPAIALATVIFLWTPAHFYNLALAYKADYARAGFPMLPVVRGDRVTRRHIVLYLGATMLGAAALAWVDALGWLYAASALVLGGLFLAAVVALHRRRTTASAMRSFHASNAYLGGLLLALVVDALVV